MHLKSKILALLLFANANLATASQVAIIIDDIGYHKHDLQAIKLPGEISYSILPYTPFAQIFSQQANAINKEVLLHIPMQSISGKALGPGALTNEMTKSQIQSTLEKALNEYPEVKGINNHMGSFLTQKIQPMAWTMEVLHERGLYFLDSKTTTHSQAQNLANLFNVNNVARHVFLDNIPTDKQMQFRMNQLIRIANKRDYAIAIAHPYPETLKFLEKELPKLKEQGIELVPLSQLVESKYIKLAAIEEKTIYK
ncbi:divergent polysaccharide deacetylase family protein [Pseudoalteromonas denitrificans]|uniref:Divergent polysaccharide deacetylase n=1 Tax=Pseudoalteromonas denitrificans DSM 6059 TaxID=1123010 RepID=A0A1I1NY53_9GAMM|nr:divergent polysaccharide deacetylase family protein [Pseudoalteromonas denitrificans]SFD02477.1 hypothetical protein SAMN02745724_03230 [Pseudoalteromonas denitrificans DSM 6059]